MYHVPEFISKFKNLSMFNLQGLEKLNDIVKHNYFKQTNHKNEQFLKQLIEKKNRMELNLFDVTITEINSKINRTL